MTSEPVVTIVVAAGSGVRLGGDVPKALRLVAGTPIVVHAVRGLLAGAVDHVVVVVPAAHRAQFDTALGELPADVWQTVTGGAERPESVRRGLDAVTADPRWARCRVLLVHDAARPLAPPDVVGRVVDAVVGGAVAVVPVVPVVDTVRQVDDDGCSHVLDRSRLRAVQTPQGFDRQTLVDAHALAEQDGVALTDDAMACEHAGHPVLLVAGARESHKITEPADLAWAAAVLGSR